MLEDTIMLKNNILAASQLVQSEDAINVINITNQTLTDNIVFKCFVLFLLVYYLLVVRQSRCNRLLNKTLRLKYFSEELFDNTSLISTNFLQHSLYLWSFSSAVVLLKLLDIFYLSAVESLFPGLWSWFLVFPLCLVFPLVFSFERLLLRLSAKVVFADELISKLLYLKSLYMSAGAILVTPFVLLFSLYGGSGEFELFFLASIMFFLLLIIWLFKTYMLFVEKKVSTLNWFLYLCTVEIFPLTLVVFSLGA